MSLTTKTKRITLRIDDELDLNLSILEKATSQDKSKIIRAILKDFFANNDQLLEEYYEKTKSN